VPAGLFQSVRSEWDSSESESVPVVHGSSCSFVGTAAVTAANVKPVLASVTEKAEVTCHFFLHPFCFNCFVVGAHIRSLQ